MARRLANHPATPTPAASVSPTVTPAPVATPATCQGWAYLTSINAVRRDFASIVYVGDTINLDPATITTVGDQDGIVYDHEDRLPNPHLPQH